MVQFSNTRAGTSISRSAQSLATDIRRRVGEVVSTFTGWRLRRSVGLVEGVLVATGGRNGYSTGINDLIQVWM